MAKKLGAENALPLYEQIAEILRDDILRGRLLPGARIESEAALGEKYGVSRETTRKAVGMLVEQGFLDRIQGRGTFIAKNTPHTARNLINFMQSAATHGQKPSTDVLEKCWKRVLPEDRALFALAEDAQVVFIRRLRRADGRAVVFEVDYFAPRYGYLLGEDISGSIFTILREKENILPAHNMHSLELYNLDGEEARLLEMAEGATVIRLEEIVYDQFTMPIYRSVQLLGPNFRFMINA